MKNLFLCLFILSLSFVNAQDTIRIKHTNYTTVYSKTLRYPILVEWWETKAKVECANKLPRKDKFAPDPLLPKYTNLGPDYVGAGFDRGHMCPAAINLCQTQLIQDECFYFSNMTAQYSSLNRGDWKSLETLTRQTAAIKDSVHVWCGSIGVLKKIGTTSVPKQCWKVVYVKATNTWSAYLFNNDTSKPTGIADNEVKLEVIEKLTNLKFKR
jgi:endonuclease G